MIMLAGGRAKCATELKSNHDIMTAAKIQEKTEEMK